MPLISSATNLGHMPAKRFIQSTASKIDRATLELASGSKVSNFDSCSKASQPISSASPASAAVGCRLGTKPDTLTQTPHNTLQEISGLQHSVTALGQAKEILAQMKTLTAQVASAETISDSERVIIDQEFQGLLDEISSLSDIAHKHNDALNTTKFPMTLPQD